MGSVPSHGERNDPGTIVYQACRDGHTTALNEVLKHLDEIERKKGARKQIQRWRRFCYSVNHSGSQRKLKSRANPSQVQTRH